ncbi:MAG: sel1 repeat family protein [Ignavibacteriales bacterium]|nr:sel1 repeat family protein [Ignavibacteriales bacterium]
MKKSWKNSRSCAARIVLITVVSLLGLSFGAEAQRKSAAGKEPTPGMMIKESSLDYQLWESFLLVRRANDGEAAAQHELAIRYLQGRGFAADTLKAVFWLNKAAERDFDLAHFNLGILLLNGWGVAWNPFEAFDLFERAARRGMSEAHFVLGLSYTEDLIVRQNWKEAYAHVKKAADAGFDPAKKALVEFRNRGIPDGTSKDVVHSDTARPKPLFIDFDVDTSTASDDGLLNDLVKEGSAELRKALGATSGLTQTDSNAYSLITRAARAGSPEAQTLLGRFQEYGIRAPKDRVAAVARYLVAVRNESVRALELIWNIIKEEGFAEELEGRAKNGDAAAQFAWAGLVAVGIDRRLSGQQALKLLQSSADQGYEEAIIELGLCYQSGRWVERDPIRARQLWQIAVSRGKTEALIRLNAVGLFTQNASVNPATIALFKEQAEEGSILAQVALGYCYERGLGVTRNLGDASRLYRNAAQRGSESAYDALKRIHDLIRPPGEKWEVG